MLSESKLDILSITETHLDGEISTEELAITGFKAVRLDREDREGGGCMIYYSENLHV